MRLRSSFPCSLVVATLAALPAAGPAFAQSEPLGLRGGSDQGFPTSPTAGQFVSPEDNTPPSTPALAPAGVEPPRTGAELEPATPQTSEEDTTGPNYGKPRTGKPKLYRLYRPDPKSSPPLPALVPYRGSPGGRKELNPAPPADANGLDVVAPGPTIAVIPSPKRVRKPPVEIDSFVPTGIEVGELRLLPFVEGSTGFETNPNQVTTGVKRSSVLRADAGLDVASDFPTNSLTASLRGGYSDFPSNPNANRPDFNGVVDGLIDVTRQDQINLEGRFALATQTPGRRFLRRTASSSPIARPSCPRARRSAARTRSTA